MVGDETRLESWVPTSSALPLRLLPKPRLDGEVASTIVVVEAGGRNQHRTPDVHAMQVRYLVDSRQFLDGEVYLPGLDDSLIGKGGAKCECVWVLIISLHCPHDSLHYLLGTDKQIPPT